MLEAFVIILSFQYFSSSSDFSFGQKPSRLQSMGLSRVRHN